MKLQLERSGCRFHLLEDATFVDKILKGVIQPEDRERIQLVGDLLIASSASPA